MPDVDAFPLYWPHHVPRTPRPRSSQFAVVGLGQARDEVLAELRRLGARDVVLSTNIPLRADGLFRANSDQRQYGGDRTTGVAVYFTHPKRGALCFACDRWDAIACNLRAIQKSIEAIRGIGRWGMAEMVDAAFDGFRALPGPGTSTASTTDWWTVLGIPRNAPADVIEARARELLGALHPDKPGGDAAKFVAVRTARDAARMEPR